MISRRAILGFFGSIGTASVLAKLSPVFAKPIPVPPEPPPVSPAVFGWQGPGAYAGYDLPAIAHPGDLFIRLDKLDVFAYTEDQGWLACGGIVKDTTGQIDAAYPPVVKRGGNHV